jgi:hypothetical protein
MLSLHDHCGGKNLTFRSIRTTPRKRPRDGAPSFPILCRLLALLLALAVVPTLAIAQGRDRDNDRGNGRFVDPIVGSWIIHIDVTNFTPTPTPPPPFNFDNLTAFWEDGITTSSDPAQGTSYGVWKKIGPRMYLTKIIQVNSNGTITTVFGGPTTLNPQGTQMCGQFHGFDTNSTGKVIDTFEGKVVDDRITFTSNP